MGNLPGKMRRRERWTANGVAEALRPEPAGESVADASLPPPRTAPADVLQACAGQWLFGGAAPGVVSTAASRFHRLKAKAGKVLLQQGDPITPASQLFILVKGRVDLDANGAEPFHARLSPPAIFGHTGLLFGTPRTATAVSGGARLLAVSEGALAAFLPHLPRARLLVFMRGQMLLKSLSDSQLEELAGMVECRTYAPGHHIVTQGQPGSEMYLVRRGTVDVVCAGRQVDTATRGAFLGQRALHGKPRTASCVAAGAVEVVAIRDTALDTLRQDPLLQRILACDAVVAVQQHSRVFGSFTQEQLGDMLQSLEETTYPPGTVIIRRGEPMHELYVVRAGEVAGAAVAAAGGFQYFGSITGQPSASDVAVVTDDAVVVKSSRARWLAILEGRRPTHPLGLDGIVMGRELGTGESGRVCLAHLVHQPSSLVAVKIVQKKSRAFMAGHALSESLLMQSISHPFLVRLYSVAEDAERFYLIMEYVSGGELFAQLLVQGKFAEGAARFYVACVVLALEYLHRNGIVYRDLKPENLLLDSRGYLKLTDFGYSKRIGNSRTFTMCGTPEYQAPEIMAVDKGATVLADYWSLGVLTYEMLTGVSPFLPAGAGVGAKISDPWGIIRNARTGRYPPPAGYAASPVNGFIASLLQVDPAKRLSSISEIKAQPWLAGFDWRALLDRKLPAPHVKRGLLG